MWVRGRSVHRLLRTTRLTPLIFCSVCKSWAKLQSDELLWKDLLKRDWNVEKEEVDGEEKEQLSWRELYRHYYEMKFLIITSESTYLRDVKLHIVEGGIR